jgi:hypothetical protein
VIAPAPPTMSVRAQVAIGIALAVFPLLVQIPFNVLIATFDYPDILRRPPAEVLARFAAGGDGLVLTWYAYALCVVPFLVTVIALPEALAASPSRRHLIRALGVISALTQLVGLLRWTLVVPALASAYVDPAASEAARAAIAIAFDTQHRLFGNLLGEHVGQLTLALWTLLIATTQEVAALRWLGRLAAGLFLLGLGDGLATVISLPGAKVIGHAPLVAFLTWTAWMVATGIALLRRARRESRGT